MRRGAAPLLVLLLVAGPGSAAANPWDLYGYNPRALAMGNAHTAAADDFTAVYYNPASLTAATEPSFGFGLLVSEPLLSLDFERPGAEPREPPASNGVSFGALFPLGGPAFRNRVSFGLGIHVPTSSLLDGQAIDAAIPQWIMYQSLPRRIVAALGLGVMPFDWLSVGAGFQILAGVTGRLDYDLDLVAGRFTQKTVDFDIVPQVAPLFGLELRLAPGLRVGASYRAAIGAPVDLPVYIDITDIAQLDVQTNFEVQYTPHQISVGASYEWPELSLTFAGDVTYALWSRAPDPSVASSLDLGGDLFTGTGLEGALDVAPNPPIDPGFRNVVLPRIGVEHLIGPFALRGGYAVRPSPAPSQTGLTNWVDTTAHLLSLGAGVRFRDPLEALQNPLIIDAGLGWLFLPGRSYQKIDPGDPVGNYRASGSVLVFSLSLRYAFGEGPTEAP